MVSPILKTNIIVKYNRHGEACYFDYDDLCHKLYLRDRDYWVIHTYEEVYFDFESARFYFLGGYYSHVSGMLDDLGKSYKDWLVSKAEEELLK